MGVLIGGLIFLACLLLPPALIYRAPMPTGWKKTKWVLGCFLSMAFPAVLSFAGITIAVKYGGYERTPTSHLFGPEAAYMAVANIAALLMPWLVYVIFKKCYAPAQS